MSYAVRLIPALVCTLALGSCVTPDPPLTVVEADAAMVQQCTYITDVSETAYIPAIDAARDAAKKYAMQAAQAKGATHVVWVSVTAETGKGQAHGKAYRCP
jgi:hypothetical protein